jgi:plasmid stabilization system protein ParE
MQVVFTPAARVEVFDAQDWYETQRAGLGNRFREEVGATVIRMAENPQQFQVVLDDVHRARLRKFPYSLFFRLETDTLLVIACFHVKRDPQTWQRRV